MRTIVVHSKNEKSNDKFTTVTCGYIYDDGTVMYRTWYYEKKPNGWEDHVDTRTWRGKDIGLERRPFAQVVSRICNYQLETFTAKMA